MLAASEFSGAEPMLIDDKTQEFEAGWVYYYQSAQYIHSGDPQDGLLGNAPLFVPRNGAAPQVISYHRPPAESIAAFLYCGNANGKPNPEIELVGWTEGALKVSATQAIRGSSSLGLGAAKEAVDLCLSGRPAKVRTASVMAAHELVSKLSQLGFAAKVTYGG